MSSSYLFAKFSDFVASLEPLGFVPLLDLHLITLQFVHLLSNQFHLLQLGRHYFFHLSQPSRSWKVFALFKPSQPFRIVGASEEPALRSDDSIRESVAYSIVIRQLGNGETGSECNLAKSSGRPNKRTILIMFTRPILRMNIELPSDLIK